MPSYTFPTGEVVTIVPLSQFTMASIEVGVRRNHPKPPIPLAPGVGGALEENPSDPRYLAAVQTYDREVNNLMMDIVIGLTVAIDWTDAKRARLTHLRETLRAVGVELEENDTVAYVKHLCMYDATIEAPALINVLMEAGAPTAEEVAGHVAAFRRQLQRPGRVQAADAPQQAEDLAPV